ncbi:MAG: hypothetical protein AAB442_00180 [Patescibacteria group bacterium]
MNTRTILLTAGGAVVLATLWYVVGGAPSIEPAPVPSDEVRLPVTPTTPAPAPSAPAPAPAKKPTQAPSPIKVAGYNTLTYLIGLKESLTCTVKESNSRTGTVYVSGGQLRGNFVNVYSGIKSSMINDGTNLYAWIQGASTGLVVPAALSVSGSAVATHGGIDLAVSISFSCTSGVQGAGVFAPPTSVTFSKNP